MLYEVITVGKPHKIESDSEKGRDCCDTAAEDEELHKIGCLGQAFDFGAAHALGEGVPLRRKARITSYNVCYTKLLRLVNLPGLRCRRWDLNPHEGTLTTP